MARTITEPPVAANDDEPQVVTPARAPRQSRTHTGPRPTPAQRAWLERGLNQPGGKLPLFDHNGQRINSRTVRACMARGWAEPWHDNPVKRDWLVCRLTDAGRAALEAPDH